jgi:hypothetical protein
VTYHTFATLEEAILGKIKGGCNTALAAAIFQSSVRATRDRLARDVWSFTGHGRDTCIQQCARRRDDLGTVASLLLTDGGAKLRAHPRLNTPEKLWALLEAPDGGPRLRDALENTSSRHAMLRTDEERQLAQLEGARALYAAAGAPPAAEEEEEEEEEEEGSFEEEEEEEKEEQRGVSADVWRAPARTGPEYSLYRAVWLRLNVARLLVDEQQQTRNRFVARKLSLFVDAHLPMLRYLDSLDDPRDDLLDVARLELAPAATRVCHADDPVRVATTEYFPTPGAETALNVLRRRWPALSWTVEEELARPDPPVLVFDDADEWTPFPEATPRTHGVFMACVAVANRCRQMLLLPNEHPSVRFALRKHRAGFARILAHCVERRDASDRYLLTQTGTERVERTARVILGEQLTPWEAHYAQDCDVYNAYDLPDLFHVLSEIPLGSEQHTPKFPVGKIYQKSLPFACQNRHMIQLVTNTMMADEAAWVLFGRLFWCMLAGLYPDEFCRPNDDEPPPLSMQHLVRAHVLSSSRDQLVQALRFSMGNGAPLVVNAAVGLHILLMASCNSRTYVPMARRSIDWDHYTRHIVTLADMVQHSCIYPADAFAQARVRLAKTVKSPDSKVHRFRRRSLAVTVAEHMNQTLEKVVMKDKHARAHFLRKLRQERDNPEMVRAVLRDACLSGDDVDAHVRASEHMLEAYARVLDIGHCKAAILNILVRLPPSERMTTRAFQLLTLPEYGGVKSETPEAMARMVHVFMYEAAAPKEFARCINDMRLDDFVVACFYFNMVAQLQKVQFAPLDADTVRRTDAAMVRRRYHLVHPDQRLPDATYDVCVLLCCNKVANLMGANKYGSRKVAYDMERHAYVCDLGKGAALGVEDDDDAENSDSGEDVDDGRERDLTDMVLRAEERDVDVYGDLLTYKDLVADATARHGRGAQRDSEMTVRKAVRNERKRFNRIPCGQPALTISLRGRALVWGNTREAQQQIMFCPECAGLHVYTNLNFSGSTSARYRCNECARKELSHVEYHECAYCERPLLNTNAWFELELMDLEAPTPADATRIHYFCRTHYTIARRQSNNIPKTQLWEYIKRAEHKRMLQNAQRYQ